MPDERSNRSEQLSVRLRPSEREVIEQAAERRGLYPGQLMRSAALAHAREIVHGDDRRMQTVRRFLERSENALSKEAVRRLRRVVTDDEAGE